MITRIQSINRFESRMDDLLSSNYILADKKITAVLQSVTASKLFYGLISFCAEGFDYEQAFARAFRDGRFFCPGTDKELIALGFCLLGDFDSKRIDLFKLIENYFPADNYDKSYKAFCSEFLLPFKNAVITAANAMLSFDDGDASMAFSTKKTAASDEENNPAFAENSENFAPASENGRKNYYTCFADVQKILYSERAKILQAKIKEDKKNDLLAILGAFKDCLFLGDKQQIRIAFLSYKYAIMNFKRLDTEIDDIERILKFCKII